MTQAQEELFTDLSQKQAATIEGGASLFISSIQALRASSDVIGPDDIYFTADGRLKWGIHKFRSGQNRGVNYSRNFSNETRINLFDYDMIGSNDYVGGLTVYSAPTNGFVNAEVHGSDSRYIIRYRVR